MKTMKNFSISLLMCQKTLIFSCETPFFVQPTRVIKIIRLVDSFKKICAFDFEFLQYKLFYISIFKFYF